MEQIPIIGQQIPLIGEDNKKRGEDCLKGIKKLLNQSDCMILAHTDVTTADGDKICILGMDAQEIIGGARCKTTKLNVQKTMIHVIAKPRKVPGRTDN